MWTQIRLSKLDKGRVWVQTICVMFMSISWSFETADYRFPKLLIRHIDTCLGVYSEYMSQISVSEQLNGSDYSHKATNVNKKFANIGRDRLIWQPHARRRRPNRIHHHLTAANHFFSPAADVVVVCGFHRP